MDTPLLQANQRLGSYVVVRLIGSGGMGEVYEAWDEVLRRKVAIKVLADLSDQNRDYAQRFVNEGRVLAKVKHSGIVEIYAIDKLEGRPYIAMEFVDGLPANEFFDCYSAGLAEIHQLFLLMAEALAFVHQNGIVHRDIKPQNFIVDSRLRCKLIDFGIAKVYADDDTEKTEHNVVLGTSNYLAPEVRIGAPATPQSDIYALGLVFFQILCGRFARGGGVEFGPREALVLPLKLRQIIQKMTELSIAIRYHSVDELLTDLTRVNLDSIPLEFQCAPPCRVQIENRAQVIKRTCVFDLVDAEVRIVLNLALSVQMQARNSDVTEKAKLNTPVRISHPALEHAIARYNTVRSVLVSQNTAKANPPRAKKKRKISKFRLAYLAVSILAGVAIMADRNFTGTRGLASVESLPSDPSAAHIGDIFDLVCRSKASSDLSYSVKVVARQGSDLIWAGFTGGIQISPSQYFLPPVLRTKWPLSDDVSNYVQPIPWSTNRFLVVQFRPRPSIYLWSCVPGGKENVHLSTRTIAASKLVCSGTGGPVKSQTFEYVAAVRHWVKAKTEFRDGRVESCALTGYSLVH